MMGRSSTAGLNVTLGDDIAYARLASLRYDFTVRGAGRDRVEADGPAPRRCLTDPADAIMLACVPLSTMVIPDEANLEQQVKRNRVRISLF